MLDFTCLHDGILFSHFGDNMQVDEAFALNAFSLESKVPLGSVNEAFETLIVAIADDPAQVGAFLPLVAEELLHDLLDHWNHLVLNGRAA